MLAEPLLLVTGFFAFFVLCIAYVHFDFPISKSSASFQAQVQREEVHSIFTVSGGFVGNLSRAFKKILLIVEGTGCSSFLLHKKLVKLNSDESFETSVSCKSLYCS
jgi:hypothetical protein